MLDRKPGGVDGRKYGQLGDRRSRSRNRRLDFAARTGVLASMRGRAADVADVEVDGMTVASRLVWSRDALRSHAGNLVALGMPVAHVYAEAAAVSVERAILAIDAAGRQEGWPVEGVAEFRAGGLADWL